MLTPKLQNLPELLRTAPTTELTITLWEDQNGGRFQYVLPVARLTAELTDAIADLERGDLERLRTLGELAAEELKGK